MTKTEQLETERRVSDIYSGILADHYDIAVMTAQPGSC